MDDERRVRKNGEPAATQSENYYQKRHGNPPTPPVPIQVGAYQLLKLIK